MASLSSAPFICPMHFTPQLNALLRFLTRTHSECTDPDHFSQPLTLVMKNPSSHLLVVSLTAHPSNILIEAFLNRQRDDFRSLICMHRLDRFFECTIPRSGGLQYEESFLCFDNFSLPPINRLNP